MKSYTSSLTKQWRYQDLIIIMYVKSASWGGRYGLYTEYTHLAGGSGESGGGLFREKFYIQVPCRCNFMTSYIWVIIKFSLYLCFWLPCEVDPRVPTTYS